MLACWLLSALDGVGSVIQAKPFPLVSDRQSVAEHAKWATKVGEPTCMCFGGGGGVTKREERNRK